MRFGDTWRYETGSKILPNRRIKGTAKLLKTSKNQTQKWEIKVTDTQTNEILEEAVIMAREGDVAIARAHELAKAWREKYE